MSLICRRAREIEIGAGEIKSRRGGGLVKEGEVRGAAFHLFFRRVGVTSGDHQTTRFRMSDSTKALSALAASSGWKP
jgi:hypothetical protein